MTTTYKTSDIKEYIELANILLEESEINLVDKFNDFYAKQFDGHALDELVVVEIWQGLNDVHELFIDMMNFYVDILDGDTITFNELEEYKQDVLNAFDGFLKNMLASNQSEYYYNGLERPRLQGVNFGIKLVREEIIANINNSLLP